MKQYTSQLPTSTLQWVQVISEHLPPFWYRTSQLVASLDSVQKANLLGKLKTGRRVFNEPSGLYLQMSPMTKTEKQRLRHLSQYEVGGFHLETFRLTTALFAKEGQHYHAMNELIERGHLPMPYIASNPNNTCIRDPNGHLLEVFIPVGQARFNFTLNATNPV